MPKDDPPAQRSPPQAPAQPEPKTAADAIRRTTALRPVLGIVLGSGFAEVSEDLHEATAIDYDRLPGFRPTGVPGHAGRLRMGKLAGVPTVILEGRLHFYEGHDLATVTFPIRVLAALGVRTLLLTNAAGGIRNDLQPGDLVAVSDHLNGLGAHPLRGLTPPDGFIDLSEVYSRRLRSLLAQALESAGCPPCEGVYAAMPGPAFETPAEIRALRTLGADLVGMSTVAEAIVARHCGLETAALSCVTNRAAGLGGRISHEEVVAVGRRIAPKVRAILNGFAARAGESEAGTEAARDTGMHETP